MCRNIKTLFNFEPPASAGEVRAAALQFVRKVSGFQSPSKANQPAFDRAVEEIAAAAARLLGRSGDAGRAARPRGRGREGAGAIGGALRPRPLTPANRRRIRRAIAGTDRERRRGRRCGRFRR